LTRRFFFFYYKPASLDSGGFMRVGVLIGLVAATGCSFQPEPDVNRVTTRAALSTAAAPILELGEDCSAQRNLCKTGQCLATSLAGRPAFICTALCSSDDDCPLEFACGEVAPRAFACVPSTNWVPAKALVRPRSPGRLTVPDAGWVVKEQDDGGR
jgi:hypothetical protein